MIWYVFHLLLFIANKDNKHLITLALDLARTFHLSCPWDCFRIENKHIGRDGIKNHSLKQIYSRFDSKHTLENSHTHILLALYNHCERLNKLLTKNYVSTVHHFQPALLIWSFGWWNKSFFASIMPFESHSARNESRNLRVRRETRERFLLSQYKVRMISFDTRFISNWTNKFEFRWLRFLYDSQIPFACFNKLFYRFFFIYFFHVVYQVKHANVWHSFLLLLNRNSLLNRFYASFY